MDIPESCKEILPEDYYFESECDANCFCNSKSLDEYLECAMKCVKDKTSTHEMSIID